MNISSTLWLLGTNSSRSSLVVNYPALKGETWKSSEKLG